MFGITNVAVIVVICYLIGMVVKISPIPDKWIPVICGVFGGILGFVALKVGLPEFPANDSLTAIAVGIVSGLAATGANQIGKKLFGGDNDNADTV